MSAKYSHLPSWASDAIAEYERKISAGEITFDPEFAAWPAGQADAWIGDWLSRHLSQSDADGHRPGDAHPIPYTSPLPAHGPTGPRMSANDTEGWDHA